MAVTLAQLADAIDAELRGDSDSATKQITGVEAIETAGPTHVTFLTEEKYAPALGKCAAGAVIIVKPIDNLNTPQLVVENVDAALIETLGLFTPTLKPPAPGTDPTARIGQNVSIAQGVSIGPYAVVDDGVRIGADTVIAAGCRIGEAASIGRNCRLDANVVIYHACVLGNDVIVQANTVIGARGFGYRLLDGRHRFIPHNGGVLIEDSVEIGANCCVDRAKFGNTIIGEGTKIDNLVQIAHNVVIGKHCLIAAHVGIAGTCKLGDGVVLAGQVGLANNIEVGAGTMVAAQAGVMRSVPAGRKLAWSPAMEVHDAGRVIAQVLRLPKTAEQVRQLVKKVAELEAAKDNKG